ncbi:MAG: TraV family lipoprotein [Proteobacteria bacterium]|nr:TraV family lipoprotein [Pseudomonadota bacterium]
MTRLNAKQRSKHSLVLSIMVSMALLSGCAMDMKYDCPLGGNGSQCMSEPHIYKAGYNNPTDATYVTNAGDHTESTAPQKETQAINQSQSQGGNLLASAFSNQQKQANLIAESLDTTGDIATVDTSAGLYRYRAPVIYQTWVNSYVDSNSDSLINAHTYNWVYRHSGWQTPLNSSVIESSDTNQNLKPISITDTQAINQATKGSA